MINEPPRFKGLNIRIPTIIPIQGRGFINQGSTLGDLPAQVWTRRSRVLGSAEKVVQG